MSVDESMSNTSVDAFLQECYTETIFNAGMLRKSLFDGRGNCENELKNFYSSFYQLWLITRGPLKVKNRMTKKDNSEIDNKLKEWFDTRMDNQNRADYARQMAVTGVVYAEQWIKILSDDGVI